MTNNPDGPVPGTELPGQPAPLQPQLAPETPGQPGSPAAPAAPASDIAALQQRLADAEAAQQRAEKIAQDNHAAFTRTQQELSRHRQAQPPADPLAPYVQQIEAALPELDPKVVKFMAARDYAADQRLAKVETASSAQTQIPGVMNAVFTDPRGAALRNCPQAVQAMQEALNQAAAEGKPFTQNTVNFALRVGAQEAYLAGVTAPAPPAQNGNRMPSPPSFPGQWGPAPGFQPAPGAAPVTAQLTPQQQAWDADIKTQFTRSPSK